MQVSVTEKAAKRRPLQIVTAALPYSVTAAVRYPVTAAVPYPVAAAVPYPVTAEVIYLDLCSVCSAANQDMLTAVLSSEVPATPLGSFPAIFNQALALGTLSRRRVYHEALQQQQSQRQKGRRWQAGLQRKKLALDVPCRSAANTAEVSDFHWHLASNDRVRCDQSNTIDVLLIVLGEVGMWG